MTEPKEFPPTAEQPFVQHLIELRDRLLRVVLVIVVIFLCLFPFANDLYSFLAEPLIHKLPQGSTMIATGVISPFLTPFKLALVASFFVSIPFVLYQAWAFIAPGLYKREQKLVFPLLISSTLLFYLGMAFAYYVVFPLVFGFMATQTPEGVAQAPDITMYLDFALKLFFAFGLAFEVPIATILVVWSGMTTAESLAAKRPYIIVGAFVFGMLLTPPDVISQTLLALPMWLLFELGLILSKWYVKNKETDEGGTGEAAEGVATASVAGASAATAATSSASTVSAKATDRVEPTFDSPDEDENDGMAHEPDWNDGNTENANESGHGEYEPMTEEEMDAELDRIEAEEEEDEYKKFKDSPESPGP